MKKLLTDRIIDALTANGRLIRPTVKQLMAEAWDEGNREGRSRAMRMMSDEPSLSLDSPNPYRGEA